MKQEVISQIRGFNRFYTNVIAVLDKSVLQSGFSLAEARVLYEIGQLSSSTARQLMEMITIDEGYLSRILHKFVNNGLVAKIQSPKDKRRYDLQLTEKGTKQLHKLEVIANEATTRQIEGLSDSALDTLLESMQNIIATLTSAQHEDND